MTNEEFEYIERNPHDENTVKLCAEVRTIRAENEALKGERDRWRTAYGDEYSRNESLVQAVEVAKILRRHCRSCDCGGCDGGWAPSKNFDAVYAALKVKAEPIERDPRRDDVFYP